MTASIKGHTHFQSSAASASTPQQATSIELLPPVDQTQGPEPTEPDLSTLSLHEKMAVATGISRREAFESKASDAGITPASTPSAKSVPRLPTPEKLMQPFVEHTHWIPLIVKKHSERMKDPALVRVWHEAILRYQEMLDHFELALFYELFSTTYSILTSWDWSFDRNDTPFYLQLLLTETCDVKQLAKEITAVSPQFLAGLYEKHKKEVFEIIITAELYKLPADELQIFLPLTLEEDPEKILAACEKFNGKLQEICKKLIGCLNLLEKGKKRTDFLKFIRGQTEKLILYHKF